MEVCEKNPVLEWIKWRIKRKKNVIIIIVGATGSSKSYDALTLAVQVRDIFGTNFTVKDNLDFKFDKLLEKMRLPKNQGAGIPFIFEEVGSVVSGASAREWQSKMNKFFFSFMQTSRHRQQIMIMTTLNFANLEKGVRNLCHMLMETQSIDYNKKIAYVKPFILQINPKTGKPYYKYLRFQHKGKKGKLKRLAIPHPPEDIVKDYEKEKHKYTDELNKHIIDSRKEKPKVEKINYEYMDFLIRQSLKNQEIADKCDCCIATVKNRKKRLRESPNKANNHTKNSDFPKENGFSKVVKAY